MMTAAEGGTRTASFNVGEELWKKLRGLFSHDLVPLLILKSMELWPRGCLHEEIL